MFLPVVQVSKPDNATEEAEALAQFQREHRAGIVFERKDNQTRVMVAYINIVGYVGMYRKSMAYTATLVSSKLEEKLSLIHKVKVVRFSPRSHIFKLEVAVMQLTVQAFVEGLDSLR